MEESQEAAGSHLFHELSPVTFVEGLFLGVFRTDLLPAYPLGKSQADLDESSIFKSLQEELLPSSLAMDGADRLSRRLGELGLFAKSLPSTFGGDAFSHLAYCRFCEQLAFYLPAAPLMLLAQQQVVWGLIAQGSREQCERYLPSLASGELKAVLVAHPTPTWLVQGAVARLFLFLKEASCQEKASPFVGEAVLLQADGGQGWLASKKPFQGLGLQELQMACITSDRSGFEAAQPLEATGSSVALSAYIRQRERTAHSAASIGLAKALCGMVRSYLQGCSISSASRMALQPRWARMAAQLYAMEATCYVTAALVDSSQGELLLEVGLLDLLMRESLLLLMEDAFLVCGRDAFFSDAPLARLLSFGHFYAGDQPGVDRLRLSIARRGLAPLQQAMQASSVLLFAPWRSPSSLGRLLAYLAKKARLLTIELAHPALDEQKKELSRLLRSLAWRALRLLHGHGEELFSRPRELYQIVDAALVLYSVSATLWRISAELSRSQGHKKSHQLELLQVRYYCQLAFGRSTSPFFQEGYEPLATAFLEGGS